MKLAIALSCGLNQLDFEMRDIRQTTLRRSKRVSLHAKVSPAQSVRALRRTFSTTVCCQISLKAALAISEADTVIELLIYLNAHYIS